MENKNKTILITGATGQIGSELTVALRKKYGSGNVIATGRKTRPTEAFRSAGPFHYVDVLDRNAIEDVVAHYGVDTILHLAAILSGVGEQNPMLAWETNVNGTLNVLNIARDRGVRQVLIPSSIGVFGHGISLDQTPNDSVLKPTTMYGVTKVCAERLSDYYVEKYDLDVRGLRFPGIISAETLPGGGTTDFAVEMFYAAVQGEPYTCFVREDTQLPMLYMPDCIDSIMQLMDVPFSQLKHHSDFNISAMSFRAGDLAAEIRHHIPDFNCTYAPDFRQRIADSWPNSWDDTPAREEWGWSPQFGLTEMTRDMLVQLKKRFG